MRHEFSDIQTSLVYVKPVKNFCLKSLENKRSDWIFNIVRSVNCIMQLCKSALIRDDLIFSH